MQGRGHGRAERGPCGGSVWGAESAAVRVPSHSTARGRARGGAKASGGKGALNWIRKEGWTDRWAGTLVGRLGALRIPQNWTALRCGLRSDPEATAFPNALPRYEEEVAMNSRKGKCLGWFPSSQECPAGAAPPTPGLRAVSSSRCWPSETPPLRPCSSVENWISIASQQMLRSFLAQALRNPRCTCVRGAPRVFRVSGLNRWERPPLWKLKSKAPLPQSVPSPEFHPVLPCGSGRHWG